MKPNVFIHKIIFSEKLADNGNIFVTFSIVLYGNRGVASLNPQSHNTK